MTLNIDDINDIDDTQSVWRLAPADFDQLTEQLENPPEPSENLEANMARHYVYAQPYERVRPLFEETRY